MGSTLRVRHTDAEQYRGGSMPLDEIDAAGVAHYAEHGWLLVDTLGPDEVGAVRAWVEEVASWPDGGGEWLQHRELTEHGAALCRSENFVPFHPGLRALLTTGRLVDDAAALLGEPAVLYKE